MTPYDDPSFSYPKYWVGRQYEHQSEVLAIHNLLGKERFLSLADVGGGYGRLIRALSQYSPRITLIEPSTKQRKIAENYLKIVNCKLKIVKGSTSRTHLPNSSVHLVTLIRVLHHLPDPTSTFREVHRILKPGGLFILEFANSQNLKSRFLSWLSGRAPSTAPVDLRSPVNIRRRTIPFVNHHPQTVLKTLSLCNFDTLSLLSVSNFRSQFLKQLLPLKVLLLLEKLSQRPLSHIYFGPSIFILAQKPHQSNKPNKYAQPQAGL